MSRVLLDRLYVVCVTEHLVVCGSYAELFVIYLDSYKLRSDYLRQVSMEGKAVIFIRSVLNATNVIIPSQSVVDKCIECCACYVDIINVILLFTIHHYCCD